MGRRVVIGECVRAWPVYTARVLVLVAFVLLFRGEEWARRGGGSLLDYSIFLSLFNM